MGRLLSLSLALALLVLAEAAPGQLFQRPSMEYRTLNTPDYEVRVQKNGRIDIIITSGATILEDLQPGVFIEGKDGIEALRLSGTRSGREMVRGPLGEGHALVVGGDRADWRIVAYPTRPRFSVELTYINSGRRPVTVRGLAPVALAGRNRGVFRVGPGADRAWLLHGPRPPADYGTVLDRAPVSAGGYLAVYNPAAPLPMVLGFVTGGQAYGEIRLDRTDRAAADTFDVLEAVSWFDPPKVVAPGEALRSETFFFSLERNWRDLGLREYGAARRAHSGQSITVAAPPHGWRIAADGDSVRSALEAMGPELAAAGWRYLELGPGWARGAGDWEADPARFPEGLAPLAAEARAKGVALGIVLDPFVVALDSAAARENPHWLAVPEEGRREAYGGLGILDPTEPEVLEYLRQLGARASRDWGVGAVVLPQAMPAVLDAAAFSDPGLTRLEALRLGLAALREGLTPGTRLVAGGPHLATAPLADALHGAQEGGRTEGARAYFLHEFTPVVHGPLPPSDDGGLPWAAMTEAAMLGGGMLLDGTPAALGREDRARLQRLGPSAPAPARPLDLFRTGLPRVLHLRYGDGGRDHDTTWDLVAVFNRDGDGEQVTRLNFAELGLDPDGYYTVYDFWSDHYAGTVASSLDVSVPAGGMRLFGLRRFNGAPMLVAVDHHFAMGGADHSAIRRSAGQLQGTCTLPAGTAATFTFLVPEGHRFEDFTVEGGEAETRAEGGVIRVRLRPAGDGALDWTLRYESA